jgi:hypothetical protein
LSEQLLNVFKLCLLVLLYLFFARVLRAVWAELREPKPVVVAPAAVAASPPPSNPKRSAARPRLVVVSPPELADTAYELIEELTIGRAAGCHISLDDRFISQVHARMFLRDGQCFIEDLGSTNGTFLNENKVAGPSVVKRGDRVKIGNFLMELQ